MTSYIPSSKTNIHCMSATQASFYVIMHHAYARALAWSPKTKT